MTSQEIKSAMQRHDFKTVAELHRALKDARYSVNYRDLTRFINGATISKYASLSLRWFFVKLDKAKEDWSREKIQDLESELE